MHDKSTGSTLCGLAEWSSDFKLSSWSLRSHSKGSNFTTRQGNDQSILRPKSCSLANRYKSKMNSCVKCQIGSHGVIIFTEQTHKGNVSSNYLFYNNQVSLACLFQSETIQKSIELSLCLFHFVFWALCMSIRKKQYILFSTDMVYTL